MASAVFAGTSLSNMFVRDCWVSGLRRLLISGQQEDYYHVRTEWSDRKVLYLNRSHADLARLFKKLPKSFPQDRGLLTSPMLDGLMRIKEGTDIEIRLNEVERLLKNMINLPWKYSRSEVVLTFFERSPLDQALKNDTVQNIQSCYPSTVRISEIMSSNGFCLANTETIIYDVSPLHNKEKQSSTYPSQPLCEKIRDRPVLRQSNSEDDPESYVTNLSYYHLVPFETDILE